MTEVLLGGIAGVILTSLAVGLFLWRERDLRANAEAALAVFKIGFDNKSENLKLHKELLKKKNAKIKKLESLVPVYVLFDELFSGTESDSSSE